MRAVLDRETGGRVSPSSLLEIDPADKRHLFYEAMKRIFYAIRESEPEDVEDESLDQFMAAY